MTLMARRSNRARIGFSLVELLVAIGIIAMLIALLMPALGRARDQANSIKCKANMHDIAAALQMYADGNNGIIFPIGIIEPRTDLGQQSPFGHFRTLGNGSPWTPVGQNPLTYKIDIPQEARWPTYVFGVWNPPELICPNDDPAVLATAGAQHSYILNKHLEENPDIPAYGSNPAQPAKMVLLGTTVLATTTMTSGAGSTTNASVQIPVAASDVVVMGEKIAVKGDYYMEEGDFYSKPIATVDAYKHGTRLGSNYLYLDWHVDTVAPQGVESSLDPWDAKGNDASNGDD